MKTIYRLKKTIPSGSHNAPYDSVLGNHWPEGQTFHKLPANRQKYSGRVAFEQIGGEEVIVTIAEGMVSELFGEPNKGPANMPYAINLLDNIKVRIERIEKMNVYREDNNSYALGPEFYAIKDTLKDIKTILSAWRSI